MQKEDSTFTMGHGYRCLLPDLRLFVELTVYGWQASVFDEPVSNKRGPISQQNVDSSFDGKEHCKLFVNTWRAADTDRKYKPLTAELQWEEY